MAGMRGVTTGRRKGEPNRTPNRVFPPEQCGYSECRGGNARKNLATLGARYAAKASFRPSAGLGDLFRPVRANSKPLGYYRGPDATRGRAIWHPAGKPIRIAARFRNSRPANSPARLGMRSVDRFRFRRAFLAKPDAEHDHAADREELALPVLERFEPEAAARHVTAKRDHRRTV
jgi:hypothetical protein